MPENKRMRKQLDPLEIGACIPRLAHVDSRYQEGPARPDHHTEELVQMATKTYTTFTATTPSGEDVTTRSATKTYTHAIAALEVQTAGTLRKNAAWHLHLAEQVPTTEREKRIYAEYATKAQEELALAGDLPDEAHVVVGDWYIMAWASSLELAEKRRNTEDRRGIFQYRVVEAR